VNHRTEVGDPLDIVGAELMMGNRLWSGQQLEPTVAEAMPIGGRNRQSGYRRSGGPRWGQDRTLARSTIHRSPNALRDQTSISRGMTMEVAFNPEVSRDNILDTIERLFSADIGTVVLEGQDGIGKTTVLRQLQRRYPDRVFAVFLSTASRWAYDPSILRDEFCDQMEKATPESQRPDASMPSDTRYAKLLYAINRAARARGEPFYFILDGLEEIPKEDRGTRDELFALLPFQMQGIRCIVTGPNTELPFTPAGRKALKVYPMTSVTREEAERFLSDLGLVDHELRSLCGVTEGVPGLLASVRRLLIQGFSAATVLLELHKRTPDLFALEWSAVGEDPSRQLVLAVLARDNRPYTLSKLAEITQLSSEAVDGALRGLRFLLWDERIGAPPDQITVRFLSESIRRAADAELFSHRKVVDGLIIESLQRDPEGPDALSQLPSMFSSAERLQDLVAYLSADRVIALYQRTSSLSQVRQRLSLGADAARKLNRKGDIVRFALQEATVSAIAESSLPASEVRALTALDETDAALSIAEKAVRIADRFKLLVAIARTRRDAGVAEDPMLRERILGVYRELEPTMLGSKVADVAADLLHSFPDLAIELVSKSAGLAAGDSDNSLDWAFAKLSIQAQRDDRENGLKRARELRDRISNPHVKRLSTEAVMLMGRLSAAEAITEARRLDQTADQLYVLRHWMITNASREDAIVVLEEALQLALNATGYSVNAQVYRELATCLPYAKDQHAIQYYLGHFDAQRSALELLGPSEEYIRLQLILARARWSFDQHACRERYKDVYNAIDRITDPASRASCLARLVTSLKRIDPERLLDQDDQLHALAEQELRDRFAVLLMNAADHFEVAQPVLEALASTCFPLGLELAGRLNTSVRRDEAIELLIDSCSASASATTSIVELRGALARIGDPGIRERATVTWLSNIAARLRAGATMRVADHLQDVTSIVDGASRARLAADMMASAGASQTPADTAQALQEVARGAWGALDADWYKIDLAYDLVTITAKEFPHFAREMGERINEARGALALFDAETAVAAGLGLRLAARAYAGLLARDMASPTDLPRLRASIERLGSTFEQAYLWAELAVRLFLANESEVGTRIVLDYLLPLLSASRGADGALRPAMVVMAAPAIHRGAPGALPGLVGELSPMARDAAYDAIARVLLRRTVSDDPYSGAPRAGFDVDYAVAQEVIALGHNIESDSTIFGLISSVVDSIASSRFADKFKRIQRNEIARQLRELAQKKFPSAQGITHKGYVVASEVVILRLAEISEVRAGLPNLIEEARDIPNLSDRAFVLSYVAQAARDSKQRKELVNEADQLADAIPVLAERIDRLMTLSENINVAEPQRSREILQKAFNLTAQGSGGTIAEKRRSIVDELYRRDAKSAASFASVLDDEVSRKKVEKRLALNRLRDSLSTPKATGEVASTFRAEDYSRAAWMQLGELLAGRTSPLPPSRTLEYMRFAAVQPVREAYPIFAYAIENAARNNGAEARQFLVPLFEACLAGAELALRAASRADMMPMPFGLHERRSEAEVVASILVKDGERHEGLAFVRAWLQETKPSDLWIADPFFTPASLEALVLIQEASPDCRIRILTGKPAHRHVAPPYDDTYRDEWTRLSSLQPPRTSIIIAGTTVSAKCPVHDRWWLAVGAGLKLGTSMNGIGGRWSELSRMSHADAAERLQQLQSVFGMTLRQFEGEQLRYSTIDL
jgi:AAA ATPase domain